MLSTIPILRVYYYIILDKGRAFNVHLKIQAFDSYFLFYKYTYKVTFTERAMGAVRTRNIIGSLVLQPIGSRVYMSIRFVLERIGIAIKMVCQMVIYCNNTYFSLSTLYILNYLHYFSKWEINIRSTEIITYCS